MVKSCEIIPDRENTFLICCASPDRERAAPVIMALSKMGYPVSYLRETGLPDENSANVYAVLLLVVRGMFEEETTPVFTLYREAVRRNIPVIPIFLDSIDITTLPLKYRSDVIGWENRQCVPYIAEPPRKTARRIAEAIERSHSIGFTVGAEKIHRHRMAPFRAATVVAAIGLAAAVLTAALCLAVFFGSQDAGSVRHSLKEYGDLTPTPESAYVYAEDKASEEGLTFSHTGNSEGYVVSGYDNSSAVTSLVIPDAYNGEPVVGIADYVFNGANHLVSLTIPDTVKEVGRYSVAFCQSLETCYIPSSLRSAGEGSFYQCGSLKSLRIPASLKQLEDYSFSACGAEMIYVDEGNPRYCSYDGNVYSSDLRTLVRYACGKPDAVFTLPSPLDTVAPDAFPNAEHLTEILAGDNNVYFSSRDGVLFSRNGDTLFAYPKGKRETVYILPDGVKTIGPSAFSCNEALTGLTLQNGVTGIGDRAFYATALTELLLPDSVTSIGRCAFASCFSLTSVRLPSGLTVLPEEVFANCHTLTAQEIPEGVTEIGTGAFRNCYALETLTLPEGITSIPPEMCTGCRALQSVTLPTAAGSIGDGAFMYCAALKSLTLPEGISVIPADMCRDCTSLTSIAVPAGVFRIYERAFKGCTALESVSLPEGMAVLDNWCFCQTPIRTIRLPRSLKAIRYGAFSGCQRLSEITVPANVAEIDQYAFENCMITVHAPHAPDAYQYTPDDGVMWVTD